MNTGPMKYWLPFLNNTNPIYDQVIKSALMIDRFISDHAAVLCQLDSVKPCTAVKEISYRQLKSIDMDALRADLTTSELCTNVFTDLDMMVS